MKLILRRALEAEAGGALVPAGESDLSCSRSGTSHGKSASIRNGWTSRRPRWNSPRRARQSVRRDPTSAQFEAKLAGKTVADVPQHEVLAVIHSSLGRQGIVETRSGSWEWRARDATGGRYVSLEPSADGVRVRMLGNYRDGLTMVAATVGALGFTVATVSLKALGADPVVALMVGGAARRSRLASCTGGGAGARTVRCEACSNA